MIMTRVLVVEDSPDIARLVQRRRQVVGDADRGLVEGEAEEFLALLQAQAGLALEGVAGSILLFYTLAFVPPPTAWLLALPVHYVAGVQVLVRSLYAGTDPVVLDPAAHRLDVGDEPLPLGDPPHHRRDHLRSDRGVRRSDLRCYAGVPDQA